jgi:hypothetical protein
MEAQETTTVETLVGNWEYQSHPQASPNDLYTKERPEPFGPLLRKETAAGTPTCIRGSRN